MKVMILILMVLMSTSVTYSRDFETETSSPTGVYLSEEDVVVLANHINELNDRLVYKIARIGALEAALENERQAADKVIEEAEKLINRRPLLSDIISWITLVGIGVVLVRTW